MIRESIAVLSICVILAIACVRAKHMGYAVAVLPLTVIPLLHLLGRGILFLSRGGFFGFRPGVVLAFIDFLAVAITCAAVVFISRKIETKTVRRLYLVAMVGYSVALGWAYIFNSLSGLLGPA